MSSLTATRREVLVLSGCVAATACLSGCKTIEQELTASAIGSPTFSEQTAPRLSIRLLNRAAFGVSPEDLTEIERTGSDRWIDRQLDPETIDESVLLNWRVRSLGDVIDGDPGTLFDIDDHVCVKALRQATILRAVYSRRQLFERMVHFWTDHFNIYAYKGEGPQYKVVDDRETIRKHALGNFNDLLRASAKSAAMLGYLDGIHNVKGLPNENYARELFELHTLGIDGEYTQQDIHEAARCFTGWTIDRHFHRGRFNFDSAMHDFGSKSVLGETVPAGGGECDGDRVLAIAATHPATARHISTKLCNYFIGSAPESLVDKLVAVWKSSGGEIKPVLRTLLKSPEMASAQPIFKRPFDFVVSALRATGADTDGGAGIQRHLQEMGHGLFEWPMPNGYPYEQSAWVSGLIPRWRFASQLASGQMDNTSAPFQELQSDCKRNRIDTATATVQTLFGDRQAHGNLNENLRKLATVQESIAVGLMSPEFQYR